MAQEIDVLGFDDFPTQVETILASHDWEEPKRHNRLRMGTVLTIATEIPRGGGSYEFLVDKLDIGGYVRLRYPGSLNNGFDFAVRVDGWRNEGIPRPSHPDIYFDFHEKREEDARPAFEALCDAAEMIFEGQSAQSALDEYGPKFDFETGRFPEALLRPLPWLFIEQDIRYWYGDGRERTMRAIREIREGKSLESFEFYPNKNYQTLDDIGETRLAIPE